MSARGALEGVSDSIGLDFPPRWLHMPFPVGFCAMVHRLSRQILLADSILLDKLRPYAPSEAL